MAVEIQKKMFKDCVKLVKEESCDGLLFYGAGGDLNEWVTEISSALIKQGITQEGWFTDVYLLTTTGGRQDLVFILNLEHVHMGKLAMWKVVTGDCSWLSDYIDNYVDQHSTMLLLTNDMRADETTLLFTDQVTGEKRLPEKWQVALEPGDYYTTEEPFASINDQRFAMPTIYGEVLLPPAEIQTWLKDTPGYRYVCGYSRICQDGEPGCVCIVAPTKKITQEEFEQARSEDWPNFHKAFCPETNPFVDDEVLKELVYG